ncbi:4-oxalocrotonate decarboxylase [Kibdelosporangium philippinense]|uniref:4-oxalocrotonate decarboxylase n=2 Tax=Kibdelosporangium philippinense TaxID=211113 RepID=A0ABS8Z8Y7_9PSEU|nr:4-oxalocrotonate decarboxylase [Kibdelosporangium philippinense]MCE7003877.1 4-oxalocrotonate decarboxylase [Kibdelosporangium philippinense]
MIEELAERLDGAQLNAEDTPSLADTHEIDIDQAYEIQQAVVDRRLARGETLTGVKLGFTSEAKMAQMGVSEVIVGRITDGMAHVQDSLIDISRYIHPKVEPEIAYRLARDVDGSVPIESCVDAVAAAVEIIDSRYRDFRFTYTDVVADNTSAAGYVIGPWQEFGDVNNRSVRLEVGSAEVTGSTSAILGDPARALTALEEVAKRRGIELRAGYVILAGAATAAIPLTPGPVECRIDGLGAVSFIGES